MKKKENLIIDFFDPEVQKIVQGDNCTVYKMENETGEGIVTRYKVFPGIELLYNDFHMLNGYNQNKLPCQGVLEINHCREGRFECEFTSGDYVYLGAGDLSISMLTNETKTTCFPLSHYHGISITINLKDASDTIAKLFDALGSIPIDIYAIRDKMCKKNNCFVMRAKDSIQHIFSELYTAPTEVMQGYFKLKVMELLLFLSVSDVSSYQERRYFYKNQVQVVKAIRKYMVEHVNKHFTLEELSEKFDIPLTSMKVCFKGVYGNSIYAYMKAYRMQAAALMLRQTNESITFIASQVGYENPSKFSEVFKKEMKMLPSVYRKNTV